MNDTMALPPIPPDVWANANRGAEPAPGRRLRGLRVPVLPSGPLLAQVGGGVATLAGVWGLAGPWLTLIVGGVAAVALGALRESKRI